jgi:hypothetical protein
VEKREISCLWRGLNPGRPAHRYTDGAVPAPHLLEDQADTFTSAATENTCTLAEFGSLKVQSLLCILPSDNKLLLFDLFLLSKEKPITFPHTINRLMFVTLR